MENIDHIIFLTPENRSFHYVLGFLEDHVGHFSYDKEGVRIPCGPVEPMTGGDSIIHDIVATTYSVRGLNNEPMTGFVAANQNGIYNRESIESESYTADPAQIMGWVREGGYPIFHILAKNFCVCTRWFSSVPTETYPNRSYMVAATSMGRANNVPRKIWQTLYDKTTIFDRMTQKGISWKIYYPDYVDLINNISIGLNAHGFAKLKTLIKDIKTGKLPTYSHVELDTHDDSISELVSYRNWVEYYIGKVYWTIRQSKYWNRSLIIIAFDEHGGFYDPILPPPCRPPDCYSSEVRISDRPDREIENFNFDRYGVRVPAILISPWVNPGFDDTIYDHTSVLAFLEHRFNLQPLTQRDKYANYQFKFRSTLRVDKIKIPKVKVTPITDEKSVSNKLMMTFTWLATKLFGGRKEKVDRGKEIIR